MKYDIIETDNYLIIVDDSEIKEGDFLWSFSNKKIVVAVKSTELYVHSKKIIAHLPLNNSPILEGVNLLPPLENEADKLAINEVGVDGEIYNEYDCETFIKGYNKAKEKYKWTDEDLRMAIKMAQILKFNEGKYAGIFYNSNEIIQFLSQPKYPIAFEQGNEVDNKTYTSVLRRHDGLTLWIGKYIY